MSRFETSTHRKQWLFTKDKLLHIRGEVNRKVTERISKYLNKDESQTGQNISIQEVQGLTVEESVELVKYYCKKLIDICKKQNYLDRVMYAALVFYRRFYLFSSLMENDPVLMLIAAIFVAGKAEEAPLSLAVRGVDIVKLCSVCNVDLNRLLKSEVKFLEGIKFHLIVFHPIRPLQGFIQVLEERFPDGSYQELCEEATLQLEAAYLTDCNLVYAPSKIALSALLQAVENLQRREENVPVTKEQILEVFIKQNSPSEEEASETIKDLKDIQMYFSLGNDPADKKLYKSASRKLKELQKLLDQRDQRKKVKMEVKTKPPPLPQGPPPKQE